MLLLLLSILSGSQPTDYQPNSDQPHPFEPCPDSPNCVIQSVEYDIPQSDLYNLVCNALKKTEPHEIKENKESFKIDAVFRIAVFGFKDDVNIAVDKLDDSKSVLHIKSASRVGYSDLGVNSRRLKRFFNHLDNKN